MKKIIEKVNNKISNLKKKIKLSRSNPVLKQTEEVSNYLENFQQNFVPVRIGKVCYMFKVNNRNTRTRCEICSKLTIKIPERCHWQVNAGWDNVVIICQKYYVEIILKINQLYWPINIHGTPSKCSAEIIAYNVEYFKF